MNLIKCSAKAMSACPDAKICCTQRHPGEFAEGSECHKFNEEVESLFTNADHIRSMTDEELTKFFCKEILCKNLLTDACYKICPVRKQCSPGHNGILEWLKQPYKENTDENRNT